MKIASLLLTTLLFVTGIVAAKDPVYEDVSHYEIDGGDYQFPLEHQLPELKFKANALSDVIDFLRDVGGTNIYVDWSALDAVGIERDSEVTLTKRDKKLSEVLDAVLAAVTDKKFAGKPCFTSDHQTIIIGTRATFDRFKAFEEKHKQPVPGKTPDNADPLDKPIGDIRFNANALSDVLDFLKDKTGKPITADWPSLNAAGIKSDSPVTLKLSAVTGTEMLKLMLIELSNDKTQLDYDETPAGIAIKIVRP